MFQPIRDFFTKHVGLKILALLLALLVWVYIINELNKGSSEELRFLRKMLPSEGMMAKKLVIKPIFTGTPYRGYKINLDQVVVSPEYCIVVGEQDMLRKIKFIYTMPIDVKKHTRAFSASIALNPIAPGVFMEETLVQVLVPIEKEPPPQ